MPLRVRIFLIICCTALLAALYLLTPRQFRFTLERHDAPETVTFTLTVTPQLFARPQVTGRVQTAHAAYPVDETAIFSSHNAEQLTIAVQSYRNAAGEYRALFAEMDIFTGEAAVTVFDFPGNTVAETFSADIGEAVLVKRLCDLLFPLSGSVPENQKSP